MDDRVYSVREQVRGHGDGRHVWYGMATVRSLYRVAHSGQSPRLRQQFIRTLSGRQLKLTG